MPTPKLSLTTGALNPQPATAPRRLYRARFIRAGRALSSDGSPTDIEITTTALQTASQAGLFDSRAVFVDHASLWENPSVDNLIGVTQSSSYDPLTQTVNGEISLYTTPAAQAIASLLDEILAEPNPPDIGLSLVFYPGWSPGSDFRQITSIRKIESIDLVFQPAADGRILAALSSFNLQPPSNPFNPCNNPLTASPDPNPFNPCSNPLTASPDPNPFNPCSNPLTASPDRNPFNPCNNPLTASPDRNPFNTCNNPLTASPDPNPFNPCNNPLTASPDRNPLNPCSNPLTASVRLAPSNPFNPLSKSADSNPLIKSAVWQSRGLAFMETCAAELSTKTGVSALAWLHARGINSETIAHYRLGYNPQDIFEPLTSWGLSASDDSKAQTVWLPRGIVIPCWEDDWLWYLKIRRPVPTKPSKTPTQKYIKVKGSQPGLFGAWNLRGAWLAVLTEGELDCILLDQQAGDLAGVATLGSAADRITRLDLTIWGRWLLSTAYILIAYDLDLPGAKGCRALQSFTDRAIHAPLPNLPGVKDITDYHTSGGDLADWLCRTVEQLNIL